MPGLCEQRSVRCACMYDMQTSAGLLEYVSHIHGLCSGCKEVYCNLWILWILHGCMLSMAGDACAAAVHCVIIVIHFLAYTSERSNGLQCTLKTMACWHRDMMIDAIRHTYIIIHACMQLLENPASC